MTVLKFVLLNWDGYQCGHSLVFFPLAEINMLG